MYFLLSFIEEKVMETLAYLYGAEDYESEAKEVNLSGLKAVATTGLIAASVATAGMIGTASSASACHYGRYGGYGGYGGSYYSYNYYRPIYYPRHYYAYPVYYNPCRYW
jgi:hypothetical protein